MDGMWRAALDGQFASSQNLVAGGQDCGSFVRLGKREITEDNNSIQEVGMGSGELEVVNMYRRRIRAGDDGGPEWMS